MSGRVRGVTGHVDALIGEDWQVASCPPGAIEGPSSLESSALAWTPAQAPSTAAAALAKAGAWSIDGPARRFDADDWWWRVRFSGAVAGEGGAHDEVLLCLDGLATVADVWLNGAPVLESDNMFLAHRIGVTLADENELVIRCRSVDALLAKKRPRPRWRAPMIEHPQLRWLRTTLLGRTPGWSPAAAAVGPWRPVRIERRRHVAIDDVTIASRLDGDSGIVEVSAIVRRLDDKASSPGTVTVVLERDGREHRAGLAVDPARGARHFVGRLVVPEVARWWPHTHGDPALYRARIEIGETVADLGTVGFRVIEAETANGGFALRVNRTPVFCRGACWTPLSTVTLSGDDAAYDAAIVQVALAGMNMIRVGGTMVYESERFFDAADAAGILVWQDLMFANMDYPEEDAAFVASVTAEVRQQLRRLEARPSVAVVCGNSEGEQQAAMWGAPRERWSPELFHRTLAGVAQATLPDVPYWPSSAHGGSFPHQVDRGTTSYYGVGAYLRPLDDARRADVRFASECLAFANVPAPSTILRMPHGASLKVHHPTWKERVPRDLGAGWDFDDVRDHYLATLFRVDPMALRYADHERFLALSRVVTGEVMAQTFGEWRRGGSTCGGALVWFLKDLWAGAGWGVIGADSVPKAPYHYLRRALAPVAMHVSDEGNNGLYLHLANDTATRLEGELSVVLFRGDAPVGNGRGPFVAPARESTGVPLLSLFDGFLDVNHAFRFGPPLCDLVVATFAAAGATSGESPIAHAFHFPVGLPQSRAHDLGLTAELRSRPDGALDLALTTRSFAQSIAIEVPGFDPEDDFFHLAPGATRTLVLKPSASGARPDPKRGIRGTVTPLNAENPVTIVLAASP